MLLGRYIYRCYCLSIITSYRQYVLFEPHCDIIKEKLREYNQLLFCTHIYIV